MKGYNIRYGQALDCTDPDASGNITVKLQNGGANGADEKVAIPLLPLTINVVPSTNDIVLLLVSNESGDDSSPLYYVSSRNSNKFKTSEKQSADALQNIASSTIESTSSNLNSKTREAIIGDSTDVTVFGKKNSDIILGTKALALRHNVRMSKNGEVVFNAETPSAIILNDDSVNVIGDKINLIGNRSGNGKTLTPSDENKYLYTEEEFDSFSQDKDDNESPHPVPFGDVLLEALKAINTALINHIHNTATNTPDSKTEGMAELQALIKKLEETLYSSNVFVN